MSRKFFIGLIIGTIATATIINFAIKPLNNPTNNTPCEKTSTSLHYLHSNIIISPDAKWVTVNDIEKSLEKNPPINVGFDIDDTLLFPKVSFEVAYDKHCPNDNTNLRKSCVTQQAFWDTVNSYGQLCPPKAIGYELIEMHKRRGDNIYFITAREKSKNSKENITSTLASVFNIKDINKVIYLGMATINTDKPGKTPAIINNKIEIFYGDSDADIAAAKAANIRGIRVIRAPNSQDNETMPTNGLFGEEVIIGSDV